MAGMSRDCWGNPNGGLSKRGVWPERRQLGQKGLFQGKKDPINPQKAPISLEMARLSRVDFSEKFGA